MKSSICQGWENRRSLNEGNDLIGDSLGIRGNPKYLQKYQFVFSQSSKHWYFFTQFFSKVDIKWYLPCQRAQDRHWYIFAKNKKLGPHFIFPTHFLLPQGLINPDFSTHKMLSSWNFQKKWNPKHFNFFFGSVPATKGVFKMVKK